MSGTPVANKPFDLWAQYFFLDEGKTLGDNFKSFKKEFSVDLRNNDFNDEKMQELKELIAPTSIRRLKNDVLELPDKIFSDVYVNLTG